MSVPASPREQIRARILELAEMGEDGLPRTSRVEPVAMDPLPVRAPERPVVTTSSSMRATSSTAEGDGAALVAELDLDAMRSVLRDCRRCKLCEGRTQVVFGIGNPRARLMFVGEGPGRDEDLQGEPFVGRAGQLLTDMIEKGMGLKRSDVYIANVVKCRPPNNRDPEPDEIAACAPFLRRQVALVRPEVIVGLGKFAVQTLLQTQTAISKLRGRWHVFEGTPLMPTFHPSYLLRSPGEKRVAWEDLKQVMEKLGLRR